MHHRRGDGQDVAERLLRCVRPVVKLIVVVRFLRVFGSFLGEPQRSAATDTPMRRPRGVRERASPTSRKLAAFSMMISDAMWRVSDVTCTMGES